MSPADSASASELTVEQYAGISAALTDGFPLEAVLENEGLEPKDWPGADTAWKQKIVGDPATFASYRARLGEAEDWLGRKVAPLDDDLAAWLGFLGAYAKHAAPFDLLGGLGLGMNDLGRLQRRWHQRLEADQELAKQAAELAKKKPSAIPKVSAAKGVLKPFPWSKQRAPRRPSPAEAKAADRHDAPAKELAFAPPAFAPHPDLQPFAAPVPAPLAPLAPPPAARSALAGTALTVDVPRGPALPFGRGIVPKEIAEGSPDEPRPQRSGLGGTALAVDVPRGPALPFAGENKAIPAPPAPPPPAKPRAAPSPLAETSFLVDVPRGLPLPFTPGPAPASVIAAKPAHEAKAPRAASKLGETTLAADIPRGPALPFAGPGAGEAKKKKLGELKLGMEIPKNLPLPRAAYTPPLTLEQHASLVVELGFAPERTAETLARYRLTIESRAELDAHYREKIAGSAEIRAAWDRAYQSYTAWLAANRRPAR